jgi:hypothetical protein
VRDGRQRRGIPSPARPATTTSRPAGPHRLDLSVLAGVHHARPPDGLAALRAALLRAPEAERHALGDEGALELRDAGQHGQQQAPHRIAAGPEFNALRDREEADADGLEGLHVRQEVERRAAEAVVAPAAMPTAES